MDSIENEEIQEKQEEKNSGKLVEVSDNLRAYLNMQLLCKDKIIDTIYEEDIDNMIERFKTINEVRPNKVSISGDIATEFIELIKNKVKERKVDLGILIIDIGGKDFSIRDFVNKAKDLSYNLKFKIHSIEDLKNEELEFLNSRYGIVYIYADNEYHIDDLFDIVKKMKEFISKNENNINIAEKSLERANAIANLVFKNFKLYVPAEYVLPQKEVVFRNGERLPLPNFRVLEDTSDLAEISNIFSKNVADYKGRRILCKECLRNDGYEMVERVSSIGNNVVTELMIDNIEYGIKVSTEGMYIVKI